jgi:hypothetical protein
MVGEHRILVADDAVGNAMEASNGVEEGACNALIFEKNRIL